MRAYSIPLVKKVWEVILHEAFNACFNKDLPTVELEGIKQPTPE